MLIEWSLERRLKFVPIYNHIHRKQTIQSGGIRKYHVLPPLASRKACDSIQWFFVLIFFILHSRIFLHTNILLIYH